MQSPSCQSCESDLSVAWAPAVLLVDQGGLESHSAFLVVLGDLVASLVLSDPVHCRGRTQKSKLKIEHRNIKSMNVLGMIRRSGLCLGASCLRKGRICCELSIICILYSAVCIRMHLQIICKAYMVICIGMV